MPPPCSLPRATTFSVTLGGKTVTKLCPGQSHAVRVSFPLARYGLVSSTAGSFKEGDPWDWCGGPGVTGVRQGGAGAAARAGLRAVAESATRGPPPAHWSDPLPRASPPARPPPAPTASCWTRPARKTLT
jgi:hypothetical protein